MAYIFSASEQNNIYSEWHRLLISTHRSVSSICISLIKGVFRYFYSERAKVFSSGEIPQFSEYKNKN